MNVREIVKAKLEELGADGLCTVECGCSLDCLFPCHEDGSECVPAKRCKATKEDTEKYDCDEGDDIFKEMEI